MSAPTPRVIVTRRLPEPIEQRLHTLYQAELNPSDRQFSADELRDALARCDVLVCTLGDRLTHDVLDVPGRRTRLLANFGAGVDHIDLDATESLGIEVTNTPGVLTEDTADLTMLLILAVARRAFEGDRELRAGQWSGWRPTHLLGQRVTGRTLGIIGMGRIGRAVARRAAHGFGMRVLYHSRRQHPEAAQAVGAQWKGELASLLRDSHFVSLHCPATPETRHLMDEAALATMPPGSFLVNTARGEIVDEGALHAALASGHLGGAALDVYETEPVIPPALLALPNVVTLPHLGSATVESRVAMGECVLTNIDAFAAGAAPPDRVRPRMTT